MEDKILKQILKAFKDVLTAQQVDKVRLKLLEGRVKRLERQIDALDRAITSLRDK